MDRHLKKTAFFGTERRPRPLERHYKVPGTQAPLPDIASRVVIGWGSEPATDTLEFIPAWPVPLIDQTAARTAATGVARVHEHDGYADQHRLVGDHTAQLVKPPVRHPRPLVPLDLDPAPDALEVFQGNQGLAAFGICDDGFTQDVVGVALESRLLARSAPECTLGGTGADLLQGTAPGVLPAANIVNLRTGIGLSAVINGKVDDAQVDADGIHGSDQRRFVSLAGSSQHPLAAHEHQVDLTLGRLHQLPLPVATGEFDALPPGQRPDRNSILAGQEPEDAFVVGLGCVLFECATGLLVAGFQTVRDLGDGPHRRLSRQAELGSHIAIRQLVQVELAPRLGISSEARQPVAGRIAPLQGGSQQPGLLWCRQQTDGGDQLHRRSGALLALVA